MEPNEVVRTDFPEADPGFEKKSVEAHLEAVAAQLAALKARIRALEVELDAVRAPGRTEPAESGGEPPQPAPAVPADDPPSSGGDPVAARLVATELVLGGAPRDEVISRIEAEYGLDDSAGLVDEVIARVG